MWLTPQQIENRNKLSAALRSGRFVQHAGGWSGPMIDGRISACVINTAAIVLAESNHDCVYVGVTVGYGMQTPRRRTGNYVGLNDRHEATFAEFADMIDAETAQWTEPVDVSEAIEAVIQPMVEV